MSSRRMGTGGLEVTPGWWVALGEGLQAGGPASVGVGGRDPEPCAVLEGVGWGQVTWWPLRPAASALRPGGWAEHPQGTWWGSWRWGEEDGHAMGDAGPLARAAGSTELP